MRPDYQDGALREKLFESYPLAAEQLIAESGGSIMRMKQALDYFDRALEIDPGNQELQEEKELAAEYLAGNEAFVQSDFGLAISHWGPIHELRPNYLDGKLKENLRLACTQSTVPNEQYCTP
jgi:tetratricopeptide (TPR) repeat protein